jgi:protein Mpv17
LEGDFVRATRKYYKEVVFCKFRKTADPRRGEASFSPACSRYNSHDFKISILHTTYQTMRTTMATRASSTLRFQAFKIKSRSFSVSPEKTAAAVAAAAASPIRPSLLLSGLWNAYATSLAKRPLLTKAGIAAVIFFASDSATQYLLRDVNQKKETNAFQWDAPRALSGATFGVVATTWLHYWWGFLEVAVGARFPVVAASQSSKLVNTVVKVALDQGIGAPLYIYSYYVLTNFGQTIDRTMSSSAVLESWKETNTRAADMLWPTMLKHWQLWPFVHCVNFYYMPLHHRVLVQNTVLVGWSGYLSHLNNGGLMTPDEEVKVTILRRETSDRLQQSQITESSTAASSVDTLASAPLKKQA